MSACPVCDHEFPSDGARDRHIEFEHPDEYAVLHEAEAAARAREVEEREQEAQRQSISPRDPDIANLAPWDREALGLDW